MKNQLQANPGAGGSMPAHRGRLLRLKQGYNPNSSSIGSYVFALSATLFVLTAAFGTVTAFLHSAFIHSRESAGKNK